jgi:hypothetical protein
MDRPALSCRLDEAGYITNTRRATISSMLRVTFVCVLGVVALVLAGCGPSAAEIQTAKDATYHGSPAEIFAIAEQVAAQTYKIGDRDPDALIFMTQPQWYSPEGGRQSAGVDDYVQLDDRSVQLALFVQVVAPAKDRISIKITPKTFQYISGSPKPRELAPEDPNLPSWIHGRVDSLTYEIYKAAQPYVDQ